MNLAFDFLSSRLPIQGLAAYSIRSEGARVASDCFSKSLYINNTEEMLTRIEEEARTLFPCGGAPATYCWTFEAHQVYVGARADGVSLVLLIENTAGIQLGRIRELLQGFLEMQDL
jgi:hypothetical protein